jgi:hypothetical protein
MCVYVCVVFAKYLDYKLANNRFVISAEALFRYRKMICNFLRVLAEIIRYTCISASHVLFM